MPVDPNRQSLQLLQSIRRHNERDPLQAIGKCLQSPLPRLPLILCQKRTAKPHRPTFHLPYHAVGIVVRRLRCESVRTHTARHPQNELKGGPESNETPCCDHFPSPLPVVRCTRSTDGRPRTPSDRTSRLGKLVTQ